MAKVRNIRGLHHIEFDAKAMQLSTQVVVD